MRRISFVVFGRFFSKDFFWLRVTLLSTLSAKFITINILKHEKQTKLNLFLRQVFMGSK